MSAATVCPVCGFGSLDVFLRRERVLVHQNLLTPTQEAATRMPRGRLSLAACERCGFVFNQAFDLSKLEYGAEYENTQTCSPAFDAYTDELVRRVIDEAGPRASSVVEVGCGKGGFLRKLVLAGGGRLTGRGFDASYVGPLSDLDGRLRFERRFYDASCTGVPADIVICRHVIEHVPDPVGLLRSVRAALAGSPEAKVFFETPCVEWILRHQVIWDFFYEHCSYFTGRSLTTAFERAGFAVRQVRHVFNGQYLWLEAQPAAPAPAVSMDAGDIPALARRYAIADGALRTERQRAVQELSEDGRIAVWGAGAKGVTFVNLVDPDRRHVACIVDLNPNKQGHHLPGTGHPIVDYRQLPALGVKVAVVMNPNYYAESRRLLDEAGLSVALVDLTNLRRAAHEAHT